MLLPSSLSPPSLVCLGPYLSSLLTCVQKDKAQVCPGCSVVWSELDGLSVEHLAFSQTLGKEVKEGGEGGREGGREGRGGREEGREGES